MGGEAGCTVATGRLGMIDSVWFRKSEFQK